MDIVVCNSPLYMPVIFYIPKVLVVFEVLRYYILYILSGYWPCPTAVLKKNRPTSRRTMSSTVNDALPASVPELDVSGANWAIFLLRFQMVIQGKGLWGHFDGTNVCPVLTAVQATPTMTTPTITAFTTTLPAQTPQPSPAPSPIGTQDEINTWERNESIARSLLG